mmetsp:Transcript_26651/g.60120  ORF Transcript_26651/g.60120 Transcript_26651/m.60120 type:complete len:86 (+) Transcript_26651:786-1043(+)
MPRKDRFRRICHHDVQLFAAFVVLNDSLHFRHQANGMVQLRCQLLQWSLGAPSDSRGGVSRLPPTIAACFPKTMQCRNVFGRFWL